QALLSLQVTFGVKTHWPLAGLQLSAVHALLSLHVMFGVNTHCPLAGLQLSAVHALLSLQVTLGVGTHSPFAWLETAVVHAFWSSQTTGVLEHAAEPALVGSQVSIVQRLLSLQNLTGVLFGVVALTPAVLSGESCAMPPVY